MTKCEPSSNAASFDGFSLSSILDGTSRAYPPKEAFTILLSDR